ncbi:Ionotropic receptor 361 [Blattella germanica]|nr:Ionotropic receptor 361 [Blattella germanica]
MAAILHQDVDIAIELHMSECILKIAETHFNSVLPIAVQTPATWYPQDDLRRNYGDILLHTLNHYSYISQVTVGYKDTEYMNSGYHLKTRNAVHPGSYILQIPSEDRKNDWYWIDLTLHRFVHDIYNPKAKFVIALNYFPYFYQRTASILFSWALRKGFIDVIVMIPKRSSKNAMTSNVEQFDIFGWIPNEQENICLGEINEIVHLDTWDVKTKTFLSKSNLFPMKEMTDMNYCELNTYLGGLPPFIFIEAGFMYGAFAKLLGEYCELSKCEIIPWDRVDIDYSITFPTGFRGDHNLRECEFLYPYFALDFTWYVPSGSKVEPWKSLFKAFTFKMWLLVVICSVFGTLFLWLIEKFRNMFTNANAKDTNDLSYSAQSTHLGIGVNNNNKGPGYTFFIILWLFYCLLINTAYQSTLFRLMVDPGEYPPIETFEELKESGLTMKTLINSTRDGDDEYELCHKECFADIADQRNLAALYSTYSGELGMDIYRDHRGKRKIAPLKEVMFTRYAYAQIIKLSCLIHNRLDTLLHRASASGLIAHWNAFYEQLWRLVHPQRKVQHVFALTLFHVQGAFYILGAGLVIAFAIFLLEIFNYKFHGSNHIEI